MNRNIDNLTSEHKVGCNGEFFGVANMLCHTNEVEVRLFLFKKKRILLCASDTENRMRVFFSAMPF
jgi:hypothetical protein